MPRVHLPDGRIVNFPEGMAPEQIQAEVTKLAAPAWTPGENSLSVHRTRPSPVISDTPTPEPDTYWGGVRKSLADQVREIPGQLNAAMQGPAHPQSMGDLAPLLLPAVGVEGAVARQGPGMLRGARIRTGQAVGATGRGMEAAGAALQPSSIPMALADAVARQNPYEVAGIVAGPPAMRVGGRVLQRAGKAIEGGAIRTTPVAAEIPAASATFKGYQPGAPGESPLAQYDLTGGPAHGSTVSGPEGLAKHGITDVPETPPYDPALVGRGKPPDPPSLRGEPGPMLGPQPKPKLSAAETAAMLREQYGSEKAGRMLYGKGKGGHLNPADRQAAIKRLAPGESALPASAARQMDAALEGATPAEAYAYAQKAPNAMAQEYFGGRLKDVPAGARDADIRRVLMEMMQGK